MYKSLLLICLSILCVPVLAQTGKDNNVPLFFEKTYLHTDREVYLQGEDIWFKAYLVNAQDNKPINYSHILYVELITPAAKVCIRHFIRMDNGLGNGDFKLPDTLSAGTYRIRAYTNWMRNFGDNFIFEKQIRVISNADKGITASTAARTKSRKENTIPVSSPDTLPAVRFFPEGGTMVSGVSSVIAVKAEDAYGRGVPAAGEIINNAGQSITRFTCDSLGFGSFTLLPETAQHYQAQINIRGQRRRVTLPGAAAAGIVLSVKAESPEVRITLNCTEIDLAKNGKKPFTITAKHAGRTIISQPVILTGKTTTISLPYTRFPEGVAILTLKDEQSQPLAERVIYIQQAHTTKLLLKTDKPGYQPREQVTVKIKLSQKAGANLSLAAVDAGASPVAEENILSYLNLQSEVKGKIEHPARYFDTSNVNRFQQLDLLLLTQGWRGFVWKKLQDTTLKLSYELEQGITITGKVRKVWSKAAVSNINITMRAPDARQEKLFWAVTDTAGRFTIYNPMIYGHQYLSFTARRSDKINQSGESKGTSGGWLQVDSLFQNTMPVNVSRLPPADTLQPSDNQEANSAIEKLRRNLNLKADRNLKEVTIKANASRLFTVLRPEIHPITLAEQKDYDNLGQYLLYMIEGTYLTYDPCYWCTDDPKIQSNYISRNGGHVIVTGVYSDRSKIDYCYICQEQYLNLPMDNVLKVTINRAMGATGLGVSVNVILRPGVLETKNYFDNTVADMTGYYKARVFYTPKIEAIEANADPRMNTIAWKPNIITDINGEATLTYYNTSQKGNVRLMVQGISDKGEPLVSTISYEVK